MKRLAGIVLLLLINQGRLAAQTPSPPAQTPAPQAPSGSTKREPVPVAVAPPGTPIVKVYLPEKVIDHSLEKWKTEFTLGYWPFLPVGNVKTLSTPGKFDKDLGLEGYKSHPYLRLALKPRLRHTFVLEGIPYRLNGATTLNRELTFLDRTFIIRDDIQTRIKLNSINFDYRYNFLSKDRGFVALVTGFGYLEANAKIINTTRDIEEVSKAKLVFPVVGATSQGYLGHSDRFSIEGDVKGMHFGNYGYYVRSAVGLGVTLRKGVTLNLGYSTLDTDLHNKYETEGVKANFKGPTLYLRFRH